MNAEVVAVGTELLLGQIANTNAQDVSRALAGIGVNVFFHTVVGDNLARVSSVLKDAAERSDCVVVTGGLGPTPDDLTREAVADAFGLPLERDERLAGVVRGIFQRLGRDMPEENLKQADLPLGAVPIEPRGTAPGFYLETGPAILFALPGVPWEMRAMLEDTVVPVLTKRLGPQTIASREIFVIGLGESHTHEKIADIVGAQTNPTIAFLSGRGQVRVRVSARAQDREAARALIDPVEAAIRERLGDAAVPGSHPSLAQAVGAMLRERALTVGAAESLTGGLLGASLTETEGASDFFAGSLVCYSVQAKQEIAGVPLEVITSHGTVSERSAAALAEGAARRFGADMGLSTTGVAGPEELEGRPVGTIFVGACLDDTTEVRQIRGYGDRRNIRDLAVTGALDLGRRLLSKV